MYDNENNNMNTNGEYQPQQSQYTFTTAPNMMNGGYYPPPPPPKKKRAPTGLVVGIIVAAIAAGSLSGFGGAYLANSMSGDTTPSSQQGGTVEDTTPYQSDDQPEETTPTTTEYTKPEIEVNSDLTSLENTVTINTTTEYTYKELFGKVNESIVVVKNYVRNGDSYTLYGTGSGVIFTTDGYIVTNAHVVQSSTKVSVVVSDGFSDNEEIDAILVGSDSATDLAVLKVAREQAFSAAALGDSDGLSVGQEVCAIGNPAGLNKTITNGIISGLNRYFSDGGYELSSIQTNAAINPGNSGGGLFDMYGNVVGIVNSKLVSTSSYETIENLGFAITINEAKPVISDLINFGYVTGRPTLGITTIAVNEYTAQLYGLSATGLLVTEIRADAPISRSDLRIGDVITAVNGTSVASVADVQAILKGMSAGDTVTLTVSRTVSNNSSPFGFNNISTTLDIDVILTESAG